MDISYYLAPKILHAHFYFAQPSKKKKENKKKEKKRSSNLKDEAEMSAFNEWSYEIANILYVKIDFST